MVGKERDRALYEALAKRLEEYRDKPEKAFKDGFKKPASNGKPGPIVRSVKIFDSRVAGLPVNGGIALNDGMVRVDLYQKKRQILFNTVLCQRYRKKNCKEQGYSAWQKRG